MAIDIGGAILRAVDIITDKKMQNLSYDKTVKATITKVASGSEAYECECGEVTFIAYGTADAYSVNDQVYVNVPEGDWDNQKNIINKVQNNTASVGSYSPYENLEYITAINGGSASASVLANEYGDSVTSTKSFFSGNFYDLYTDNSGYLYDTIGLRFKVNVAALTKYNIIKTQDYNCTYGILIRLYELNENKEKILVQEYRYTTDEMFGNLYGFDGDMYQEATFNIQDVDIKKNLYIEAKVFEGGDFGVYDSSTNSYKKLTYSDGKPDYNNIIFKDIVVELAVNKENYSANQIVTKLISDNKLYYYAWGNEENTKEFMYTIYNSSSSSFNESNLVLCYAVNDDTEWNECDSSWKLKNDLHYSKVTIPLDCLRQDKVRFKYRMKVISDSEDTVYTYIESNEITCLRYALGASNLEDEQSTALTLEYQYIQNYPANKYPSEDTTLSAEAKSLIIDEDNSVGVKYVGFDNKLRTRTEAFLPHFIHAIWSPKEPMFQDPTYLAGATITWKVPCPHKIEQDEKLALEEEITDEDRISYIKDYFNQNTLTVFMDVTEGMEYYPIEGINKYSFERDSNTGLCYFTFSHTFSEDFIFPNDLKQRGLTLSAVSKEISGTTGENFSEAFYLTWRFRVKEQYLNTMSNNSITCTIVKDQYTFTSSIDLTTTTSSTVKKGNIRLIKEDFEPLFLQEYVGINMDTNATYPAQIINFKPYIEDYSYAANEDDEQLDLKSQIMRPVSDLYELKKGYSYFDSNNELVNLDISGYYSLIIPNEIETKDFGKDTSLVYDLGTMSISNNTPYRENEFYFKYEEFYHGLTIGWYDVNQGSPTTVYKDSYLYIPVNNFIGKTIYINTDKATIKYDHNVFTEMNTRLFFYIKNKNSEINEVVTIPLGKNTTFLKNKEVSIPSDSLECGIGVQLLTSEVVDSYVIPTRYSWGNRYNIGMSINGLIFSEEYDKGIDLYGLKGMSIFTANEGRGVKNVTGIPTYVISGFSFTSGSGHFIEILEGNGTFYVDNNGSILDQSDVNRMIYMNSIHIAKLITGKTINSSWGELFQNVYGNIPPQLIVNNYNNIYSFQSGDNENQSYFYPSLDTTTENDVTYKYVKTNEIILSPELGVPQEEESHKFILPTFVVTEGGSARSSTYPGGPVSMSLPVTYCKYNQWSDDFNNWDGKSVQINDDSIFASAFAAGTKDSLGQFSGVVLGKIGVVDSTVPSRFGLYGYNKDVKSFGLTEDGKAFFGKEGRGQILLDGNKSTLQSYRYAVDGQGLMIDLDDGLLHFKNKLNDTQYYMKLDVSDSNLSSTDCPIRIGTSGEEKFTVDWDGTLRCKNAYINGARITGDVTNSDGSTTIINGDGSLYNGLIYRVNSTTVGIKGNIQIPAGASIGDAATGGGSGVTLSFGDGKVISSMGLESKNNVTLDGKIINQGYEGKNTSLLIQLIQNGATNSISLASMGGIIYNGPESGLMTINLDNYVTKDDAGKNYVTSGTRRTVFDYEGNKIGYVTL